MSSAEATITVKVRDLASPELKAMSRSLEQVTRQQGEMTRATGASALATQGYSKSAAAAQVATRALAAGVDAASFVFGELAGALKAAVAGFAEFDDSITRAIALTRDGAAAQREMTRAAEEAGLATTSSATDAARAMTKMAMSGMNAADQIKAVKPVLDLANVGFVSLEKSADAATNILSTFKLAVGDLVRVSDMLAVTMTSSNVSFAGLAKSIEYVGPIAQSTGQDLGALMAMIGTLGNNGIQASKAGTGLRGILGSLAKPSKQAQTALDELNVSLYDTQGRIRQLPAVLRDLRDAGATAKDMFTIFGREGATAASALTSSVDDVDALTDSVNRSEGATKKMAGLINKSLGNQLKILSGTVQTLQSRLGAQLAPSLQILIERITRATRALAENEQFMTTVGSVAKGLEENFDDIVEVLGLTVGAMIVAGGAGLDLARGLAYLAREGEQLREKMTRLIIVYQLYKKIATQTAEAISDGTLELTNTKRAMELATGVMDTLKGATDAAKKSFGGLKDEVKLTRELLFADDASITFIDPDQSKAVGEVLAKQKKEARELLQAQKAAEAERKKRARERAEARKKSREDEQFEYELAELRLKIAKEQDAIKKLELQKEEALLRIRKAETSERVKDRQIALQNYETDKKIAEEKSKATQSVMAKLEEARKKASEAATQRELLLRKLAEDNFHAELERQALLTQERQTSAQQWIDTLTQASSVMDSMGAQLGPRMQGAAKGVRGIGSAIAAVYAVNQGLLKGVKGTQEALAGAGQAAAGFAEGMGASASVQSAILAAFEGASSIASFAAGDIKGGVLHAAAAAQYAVVAGTSAGSGGGASSGGGGGLRDGASGSVPSASDAAKESAEIFAEVFAEKTGGRNQSITIDLRNSIVASSGEQLYEEVRRSARTAGVDLDRRG